MSEPRILNRILAQKHREVSALKSEMGLQRTLSSMRSERAFARALEQPGLQVIAEIKRCSPSEGPIRPDLLPQEIALMYAEAGAAAISVLTDGPCFGGAIEDIQKVKSVCGLPVLCKDFIVDEVQIEAAQRAGADAILLIVRILEETQLARLLLYADRMGMDALVETHNPDEIDTALRAGATILGVNCRDLDTLEIDVHHHRRLSGRLPESITAVAESGMRTGADLIEKAEYGYDAALIGSHLMKAAHPGKALRTLLEPVRQDALPV